MIRKKLLRNHNLDQVNFAPTSLPIVFSWLGNLNDDDEKLGLSQLFGILRSSPCIMMRKFDETRGVKRKETNDN